MPLDFTALRVAYDKRLSRYGVEWPIPAEAPGLWLLHDRLALAVSQEELVAFYRAQGLEYNRQLRHLAGRGWYLASGNTRANRMPVDKALRRDELMLVSVDGPNPIWQGHDRLKRLGRASAANWGEVLTLYGGHGCAVCGQQHAHYDRGHLDPCQGEHLGNLVPMCVSCNNWAGARNVAFELDGLIARPVITTNPTDSQP